MGTSKSFSTLKKNNPNWPALSSSVTRGCNGTSLPTEKVSAILGNYVSAVRGIGNYGRGSSSAAKRSGANSVSKLGRFLSIFIESGGNLKQTLDQIDSDGVIKKKPVSEIIDYLIDHISGAASTLDDRAAKQATRLLLEELLQEAESIKEAENLLKDALSKQGQEEIVVRYFGYYIYEQLDTWFYEKLVKEKGKSDFSKLFAQIKNYIFEKLKGMAKKFSFRKLEWGSDASVKIVENIQDSILKVFVYEN